MSGDIAAGMRRLLQSGKKRGLPEGLPPLRLLCEPTNGCITPPNGGKCGQLYYRAIRIAFAAAVSVSYMLTTSRHRVEIRGYSST